MRLRNVVRSSVPGQRPTLTKLVDRGLALLPKAALRYAGELTVPIPKRLLIVKVHGMGDSVLIKQIIGQITERYPEVRIGVLAGAATREVMTLGEEFQVHLYSQRQLSIRSVLATLHEIRRAGYDTALNFEQGSVAGTAFVALTGIPIRIGFVTPANRTKALFLTHRVSFDEQHSMWQSFISLARIIAPDLTESPRVLNVDNLGGNADWINNWWKAKIGNEKGSVVVLHVGCATGMDFKRWPLERFVELAEHIRRMVRTVTIVLTGTGIEKPTISKFLAMYTGRAIDASDVGTIARTAAILLRSSLLVSNDTGVMHLGAALGVPTVGLFGPTSPVHWGPVGPRATYVRETSVACSPCVSNYQDRMPSSCVNLDRGRCLRDINVEAVVAAAKRVSHSDFLGC